jgi:hypothetical protein
MFKIWLKIRIILFISRSINMINKLDYHESKLAAWLIKTFSIYSHKNKIIFFWYHVVSMMAIVTISRKCFNWYHGYNMIPIKTFYIFSYDCHHWYNMIPIKTFSIFSHDCHHWYSMIPIKTFYFQGPLVLVP